MIVKMGSILPSMSQSAGGAGKRRRVSAPRERSRADGDPWLCSDTNGDKAAGLIFALH